MESRIKFLNDRGSLVEFCEKYDKKYIYISTNQERFNPNREIEIVLSDELLRQLHLILNKVVYRKFIKGINCKGGSRNTEIISIYKRRVHNIYMTIDIYALSSKPEVEISFEIEDYTDYQKDNDICFVKITKDQAYLLLKWFEKFEK